MLLLRMPQRADHVDGQEECALQILSVSPVCRRALHVQLSALPRPPQADEIDAASVAPTASPPPPATRSNSEQHISA